MERLIAYIKATQGEMRHVSWPSRQQAAVLTVLVILISLAAAVFLGFFDFVFSDIIVERFFLN